MDVPLFYKDCKTSLMSDRLRPLMVNRVTQVDPAGFKSIDQ